MGITGKAQVGRKLTARTKGCPAAPTSAATGGSRAASRSRAPTKATYKIKRSKLGKRIKVQVTVSAPGLRRRAAGQPADHEGALGREAQQRAGLAGGHRRALGEPAQLDGAVDELARWTRPARPG